MVIGVTKEIKEQENRVAITPSGVDGFAIRGHKVFVETGAGLGSGFSDEEYVEAGAVVLDTPKDVFDASDMVMKVKEPLPQEYGYLREGLTLFAYLHLAPDSRQTKALLDSKIIGIAYETVQKGGSLPLLMPMSEVAGRMSVQVGANLLLKLFGGRGVLLGGVPGVEPGHVVIIGGGNVGLNAAKMAVGLGARVTILDVSAEKLEKIDNIFGSRVVTLMSNNYNIAKSVADADLVIGAVLIPGAKTPMLVTEAMVRKMRPGAAIVDVAIDQGGCIETVDRITSHSDPFYIEHGVVHYSVPNMPGAVPRTSTFALTNATMPYAYAIADLGPEKAMAADPALMAGLNVYKGKVTCKGVADAQGLEHCHVRFS